MSKGLIAAAAAAMACAAQAGAIEIEPIRLGMTRGEFVRALPQGALAIAGANARQGPAAPAAQFRDGRLEQFSAYFAAQDFERIRRAVVAKNAGIECSGNQGVSVCYAPAGTFVLTRSGDTTMLLLQTPRMAAEAERSVSALQPAPVQRASL